MADHLAAWLPIPAIVAGVWLLDGALKRSSLAQRFWLTRSLRGRRHEWPLKAVAALALVAYAVYARGAAT